MRSIKIIAPTLLSLLALTGCPDEKEPTGTQGSSGTDTETNGSPTTSDTEDEPTTGTSPSAPTTSSTGFTCAELTVCPDTEATTGPSSDDTTTGPTGVCGDGEADPGEQCDDGNTIDSDGCSGTCVVEECTLVPNLPRNTWSLDFEFLVSCLCPGDKLCHATWLGMFNNVQPSNGFTIEASFKKVDDKPPPGDNIAVWGVVGKVFNACQHFEVIMDERPKDDTWPANQPEFTLEVQITQQEFDKAPAGEEWYIFIVTGGGDEPPDSFEYSRWWGPPVKDGDKETGLKLTKVCGQKEGLVSWLLPLWAIL